MRDGGLSAPTPVERAGLFASAGNAGTLEGSGNGDQRTKCKEGINHRYSRAKQGVFDSSGGRSTARGGQESSLGIRDHALPMVIYRRVCAFRSRPEAASPARGQALQGLGRAPQDLASRRAAIAGDELRAIKRCLAARADKPTWLFASERQAQIPRPAVNYIVRLAGVKAKLGRAWPHMLRHSCGSVHDAPPWKCRLGEYRRGSGQVYRYNIRWLVMAGHSCGYVAAMGGTYPRAGITSDPPTSRHSIARHVPAGRARAPAAQTAVSSADLAGEQPVEFAFCLEFIKFIAAADVCFTDPDLRHGAPPIGLDRHFLAHGGIGANVDLFEVGALLCQQALGHQAVRAKARGIENNPWHPEPVCRPNPPPFASALRNGLPRETPQAGPALSRWFNFLSALIARGGEHQPATA
jgi:hypothetical protein